MGGATQSLLLLVKQAMSEGFSCKVLFLRDAGNAIDRYRQEDIDVLTVDNISTYAHAHGAYNTFISRRPWRVVTNWIKTFRSVDKSETILRSFRPTIVYLNTSVIIPFAIAARKLEIPVIWHLREQIHHGNFGIRRKLIQDLFKSNATKVISISQVNAKALGIEGTDVIYNSVDFKYFNRELDQQECRKKFGIIAPFSICFIGGKVQSKGADLIIMAIQNLLKFRNDFQLLIAGEFNTSDKKSMNRIERTVFDLLQRNKELVHYITFTGPLHNVAELLAATDVLVWPATKPHFARPIMEAMVMGKPVIASDFESTREIIEHNRQGLLVSTDYKNISLAIQQLMNDDQLRLQMGMNGYEKAKSLFDAKMNNKRILDQISALIND